MFQPVSPKMDVIKLEMDILKYWQEQNIFARTVSERAGAKPYVFYEGPPTANGKPGAHHLLSRVFKDLFPRYKIMQGFYVDRRGGWDTHGLPVEIEIEKKLGFKNKKDIEEFGIDKFNQLCRESAFTYIKDWEALTDRIGFWVDLERAYITYENSYIETVWWILNQFWQKDLLYQGFKVVPYCPRCGTPLSDHEVALGYEDAEDPSVFVRMHLKDQPDTSFLVWTTTPWTLPANVAIAAGADVDYVKIEREVSPGKTEKLILAEALLEKIFENQPYSVTDRFKGRNLLGVEYEPLFSFLPLEKPAHRIIMGDFVTTEDGTGLVHIAPAFGADDMLVSQENNFPVLQTVAADGTFIPEVMPWAGVFVKDADPLITADLEQRGMLFRSGTITHTYPFCWRCSTPLLYYARPTWYVRTSAFKKQLVQLNEKIGWYPEHIKQGRFGNWLENNIDWALGRERFWGTPLPVWQCQDCNQQHCIGSVAELSRLSGQDLSALDLHRPHVDNVFLTCQNCGGTMKRVPELIDVWFDSGSMPYGQWHYPFENQSEFQQQYPADYICEAVDQTRGWFYSLHAISTLLNNEVAFKNVICLGLILDGDGLKMSKSRGNVLDPWEVINKNGADAVRWYLYTASPPGQDRRFSSDLVGEVLRNFTLTLWNTYSFFVTYANLDGWSPDPAIEPEYSALDRWLLSALHTLVRDVTFALDHYDVLAASRPIQDFVDNLSNWFLRRSRRRFWKSESDGDKFAAYATLYEALLTVSKLLAPFMPFLADEIYLNLVGNGRENGASVHLAQWPQFNEDFIDEKLNREMETVMKLASVGHAARNKANRKVRQPLAEAAFSLGSLDDRNVIEKYADILLDELNVKKVRLLDADTDAVAYEIKPLPKQLGQKYGAKFPLIRESIQNMDAEPAAKILLSGQPLSLTLNGETLQIFADEVEVRMQAKKGYAVATEGAYLAALVTDLTPELEKEGLAREFVRRVQDLRKTADFEISNRIRLVYQASPKLAQAITDFTDYICSETLTVDLYSTQPSAAMTVLETEFDGETVLIGIERVLSDFSG